MTTLPTPTDFYLNVPLYKGFKYGNDDFYPLTEILFYNGLMDCYCSQCQKESTFHSIENEPHISHNFYGIYGDRSNNLTDEEKQNYYNQIASTKFDPINKKFYCARNHEHTLFFTFLINGPTITKVGQFPSIADFSTVDLKKYREILGKERYTELTKGIGLVSHGVGIGSFVYLRRIFEHLIEEAHLTAKITGLALSDEEFNKQRMDEKIVILKHYLPIFLVQNRKLYGILSKGVHQLTEQECLAIFPSVKLGIELILDEKLLEFQRQKKIQAVTKDLSRIQQTIN